MGKPDEFSKLFRQLDCQKQIELIDIMGNIASNSRRKELKMWEAYVAQVMKNFSLTGRETTSTDPVMVLAYPKALSYFSLMPDKYQDIILTGLKGMK